MAFEDSTNFDWSKIGRSAAGAAAAPQNSRAAGSVFDLVNPANARRAISGLFPGGGSGLDKITPNIGFGSSAPGASPQSAGGSVATPAEEDDWRVRISLSPEAFYFYKNGTSNNIQSPLLETSGIIWPYTPQITVSHSAEYTTTALTHSNYPAIFYNHSVVNDITIAGDFTVQSIKEGQYLLAAIYFLRSCTKMFFGQGANAGNPPPIVFLDGYGSHYFPHVPCVVTTFQHTMPSDADYINIPISSTQLVESVSEGRSGFVDDVFSDNQGRIGAGQQIGRVTNFGVSAGQKVTEMQTLTTSTRLPTISNLSVTLKPIYSRKNLHDRFDLDKFSLGGLLSSDGYGGFI